MNSEYYNESEVMRLLGYKHKSSVKKLRAGCKMCKISTRFYYLREDVDRYISDKSERTMQIASKAIESFEFVDIDFEQWIPLSDAMEIYPHSRQQLYQICNAGKIRFVTFDGFRLFNKEDLCKLTS